MNFLAMCCILMFCRLAAVLIFPAPSKIACCSLSLLLLEVLQQVSSVGGGGLSPCNSASLATGLGNMRLPFLPHIGEFMALIKDCADCVVLQNSTRFSVNLSTSMGVTIIGELAPWAPLPISSSLSSVTAMD